MASRLGLHFYIPGTTKIHPVSVRTTTRNIGLGIKSKDNVFCYIHLSVASRIADVEKAFYKIDNTELYIRDQVNDPMRGILFKLDDLFASKDEIQRDVMARLKDGLERYGLSLENAMVIAIEPDRWVPQALNDINAASRERQAALDRAEADKLRIVKEAEAEAARKNLYGKGLAAMRDAMIQGWKRASRVSPSRWAFRPTGHHDPVDRSHGTRRHQREQQDRAFPSEREAMGDDRTFPLSTKATVSGQTPGT